MIRTSVWRSGLPFLNPAVFISSQVESILVNLIVFTLWLNKKALFKCSFSRTWVYCFSYKLKLKQTTNKRIRKCKSKTVFSCYTYMKVRSVTFPTFQTSFPLLSLQLPERIPYEEFLHSPLIPLSSSFRFDRWSGKRSWKFESVSE